MTLVAGELEGRAESGRQQLGAVARSVAREQAVATLEREQRAREPGLREPRREVAAVRCPAGVEALRPGAVGEELEPARGLAGRDAERVRQLGGREPEQLGGRRGGGERPDDRGRVEAPGVRLHGVERAADAAGHLVARDDRGQQLLAARALQLGGRERRRDGDDRRMQGARAVRVVELDRVRVDAVREDGPLGSQRPLCDHGGEGRPLARAHGREHPLDGLGRVDRAAADCAPEVVEQQLLGVGDRRRVDVGVAEVADPGRERLGGRRSAHGVITILPKWRRASMTSNASAASSSE